MFSQLYFCDVKFVVVVVVDFVVEMVADVHVYKVVHGRIVVAALDVILTSVLV